MEEYKSNSIKTKQKTEETGTKVVKKVIDGSVKKKKKGEMQKFTDAFISEDAKNVKSYVVMDVLIPTVKKAISDIVKNGIDIILNGEITKHNQNNKPSYRSYYDNRNNSTNYRSIRKTYSFEEVILDNRADAEEVLDSMFDIVERYGVVTIADMYDLVGVVGNYTDNKYGWTDLRMARVERDRDGGYLLRMPKPLPL